VGDQKPRQVEERAWPWSRPERHPSIVGQTLFPKEPNSKKKRDQENRAYARALAEMEERIAQKGGRFRGRKQG